MGKATESLLSGHPEIEVWAAGGAVWRTVDGQIELLLVRRESHKDWTMPKGKLDDGETLRACAFARSRRRPVSAVSPAIGCRSSPTPTAEVDRRRWSTGQ